VRRALPGAAARRRGLGEVLHYFIPEDEQRRALERVAATRPGPTRAPRWCLISPPERPLLCALGLDLAAVLARAARGAILLAPFARPALLPRAAHVHWETCGTIDGDPSPLLHRLEKEPPDDAVLLLAPPGLLAQIVGHPAARGLDGILLPVDASARGIARALSWLGAGGPGIEQMRIGALLVGAANAADAEDLAEQLTRAARRELGLEVRHLAHLERDDASYRSLLHGQSIVDIDSTSRASESLRGLSERLVGMRDAR
jgi:hypothetical protein